MGKNSKYLIIGGVLLLLVVGFYFLNSVDSGGGSNAKEDQADTTVVKKPVNPAGTYLLYNLLKSYENTVSIGTIQTYETVELDEVLPMDNPNDQPNLYVNIIDDFFLFIDDREYLAEFVAEGNYAFISANTFSASFAEDYFEGSYITQDYFFDTAVAVNFFHPKFQNNADLTLLSEDINFHGHPKFKYFNCFDNLLLEEKHIHISESNHFTNCIMIPHGDGFFILCSQPGNFSNINIARKDGKTNAENIFSHFPATNIYWHQNFGKYSEYRGIAKPNKKKIPQKFSRSSPLQYILSQPALFIALILCLAGLLLYIIVFSKRRQKIIPPIESNENSSLEFIDVVSKLYFQQKQHNKLVNHMIQIFIHFLRERYYINLAQKDPNVVKRISEKSGISEEKIKNILETMKSAKSKKFTEQELVDLHVQMEYFYRNCN